MDENEIPPNLTLSRVGFAQRR